MLSNFANSRLFPNAQRLKRKTLKINLFHFKPSVEAEQEAQLRERLIERASYNQHSLAGAYPYNRGMESRSRTCALSRAFSEAAGATPFPMVLRTYTKIRATSNPLFLSIYRPISLALFLSFANSRSLHWFALRFGLKWHQLSLLKRPRGKLPLLAVVSHSRSIVATASWIITPC